jgi:hypothetical protein
MRNNLAEMKSREGPSPEDGRRDIARKLGLGRSSGSRAVDGGARTAAGDAANGGGTRHGEVWQQRAAVRRRRGKHGWCTSDGAARGAATRLRRGRGS